MLSSYAKCVILHILFISRKFTFEIILGSGKIFFIKLMYFAENYSMWLSKLLTLALSVGGLAQRYTYLNTPDCGSKSAAVIIKKRFRKEAGNNLMEGNGFLGTISFQLVGVGVIRMKGVNSHN